ncbi:NUMOD1 domain-containing DNA-binding protein [Flavobacterium sp. GT3R68]|uniref:NUMOD1 domain-containing DNA-binding protein n=1 Tax=Flavobacterium sp. GT3R68 TaxID=2594437 RepID=UPI000F88EC9E|nr:NUMOD1 domain-containing DNA-binding protein [Flavobacterium sp. GT3R68]RTY96041.1 endonuclease [Flavobacterium sp. GSN2]TRW93814.1 endonuclease [Flavobacterium sp. GT3R68]
METNIIYKAINTITQEVYIGATAKTLEDRIEDHIQKANKSNGSYFQEAIATYGADAFVWEAIDTAETANDLAEKERNFIIEFNSQENGYNSNRGGGFKKTIYQYDFNTGEFLNSYEDLQSAATAVDTDKRSISNSCLQIYKSCKQFYWSYTKAPVFKNEPDCRKKFVSQYSLDGTFIADYSSAAEASRKTDVSKTSITRCCRGETEQSKGFVWKYS